MARQRCCIYISKRHSYFPISLVSLSIFSRLNIIFRFFVGLLYSFQGLQRATMSSSSTPITKNTHAVSQTPSPSQSQSSSTTGAESYPQRRSGGSGSFGAGSASRTSPTSARNSQSSRKQHKGQRRPRLADEDAAAESVSFAPRHLDSTNALLTWITLLGGDAIYQQSERTDFNYSSHELCIAASSPASTTN